MLLCRAKTVRELRVHRYQRRITNRKSVGSSRTLIEPEPIKTQIILSRSRHACSLAVKLIYSQTKNTNTLREKKKKNNEKKQIDLNGISNVKNDTHTPSRRRDEKWQTIIFQRSSSDTSHETFFSPLPVGRCHATCDDNTESSLADVTFGEYRASAAKATRRHGG